MIDYIENKPGLIEVNSLYFAVDFYQLRLFYLLVIISVKMHTIIMWSKKVEE